MYIGYMAFMIELIDSKPSSFEEAISRLVWVDSMVEKYDSIMNKNVWEVVPRLENKLLVGSGWIYKVKHAADGSIEKYKARFVAKGFSCVVGLYYEDTFSPVVIYPSIRTTLALTA